MLVKVIKVVIMHGAFPKILGTATLNDKGQLVIPREARQAFDLAPGSKLVIMSSQQKPALILIKAESVEAMIKDLSDALDSSDN